MVLELRPDSRATFRKEMPRSAEEAGAVAGCGEDPLVERNAGRRYFGDARASTFRSGSTTAERLSDWRNARRVKDKRSDTFLCSLRAPGWNPALSFIVRPTRQCKHTARQGQEKPRALGFLIALRRVERAATSIDTNWSLAEAAMSSFAVSWESKDWARLPPRAPFFLPVTCARNQRVR